LALSNLIDISVTVSPGAVVAPTFNQGLFVGPSTAIPSYGANSRLRQYPSTAAMLADGFTSSEPEYIAAQIYFSQTPAPQFIWIGRQDLTAIKTALPAGRSVADGAMSSSVNPTYLDSATADFVSGDVGAQVIVAGAGVAGADLVTTIASVTSTTVAVLTVGASTTVSGAEVQIGGYGKNYKANDQVTVVQSGGSYGVLTVLTVGADGQVLTLGTTIGNQGTGYSVANNLATTGGSGTGLEVDITAVGETLLEASQACRAANTIWYGLAVNNPADADNLAIAEWADPLWQTTRYYPWSADAAIAAGTADNLALQLQTLELRVLGIYSTTQGGLYPNNIYAAAGLMGVEMGLNTGLAGSFFTVAYKSIAGIAPEPLTQTQYTAITQAGFNVYANFGPYQTVQPGFMSNAAPSYLWLNLAMLVSFLQLDEMAVLTTNPAVPQTNPGEHLLINAANQACTKSQGIGFLADGTWEGVTINIPGVQLTAGQAIPGGFLNQAQPYSQQSTEARDAGQAMPIYCAITTAGAVQSLLIGVYAQL
jgi:hypothetical protein